MKNTYLITGATGFVGSCLAHKLVKDNQNVHIISRSPKTSWRLADISNKLIIHEADLLDKELFPLIKKINPEYVFHLATYGSLPQEKDIQKMIKINLLGTANLISGLKETKFKLLINTGSSAEYASKNSRLKETDSLFPANDYGISKVSQTLYCQKEAVANNLSIISFRLFSPFGYYEQGSRLIPHIILNALKNSDVSLSNPNFVRDFIFIEDVISLYLKACKTKIKPGEIYNVGSSHQQTVKSVVDKVLKITKSNSKPIWNTIEKQKRQIEPKVWEADITKAKKTFGWEPKYDLEKGLEQAVKWYKTNQNLYA